MAGIKRQLEAVPLVHLFGYFRLDGPLVHIHLCVGTSMSHVQRGTLTVNVEEWEDVKGVLNAVTWYDKTTILN